VDQEDQGDHNPPWWTRNGFYILLMETFAEKTKTANPVGFTMTIGNKEKKRITTEGKMEKTLLIPKRERRLSIRFNRRKEGIQGFSTEISTQQVRLALNDTLKGLNIEAYFLKADKTRMEDVHLCLAKTRAANIVTAKKAMDECMRNIGKEEFMWVPDTKKVKVYINEVPLMKDGFG